MTTVTIPERSVISTLSGLNYVCDSSGNFKFVPNGELRFEVEQIIDSTWPKMYTVAYDYLIAQIESDLQNKCRAAGLVPGGTRYDLNGASLVISIIGKPGDGSASLANYDATHGASR